MYGTSVKGADKKYFIGPEIGMFLSVPEKESLAGRRRLPAGEAEEAG